MEQKPGTITTVIIDSQNRLPGTTLEQAQYDIAWDSIMPRGEYLVRWKYVEQYTPAAPLAPTNVVATPIDATSMSIAFTPSAFADSYTMTSSPGGFTVIGLSSPIIVSGLSPNTIHTFTATATNTTGTSPPSLASTAQTTFPLSPTTLLSNVLSSPSVSVAFTAPTGGNGTITSYTMTSSPAGFTGSGTSPITVSGLTPNTIYTFTATATNSGGTSVASTPSVAITTIPSSPTSVVVSVIDTTSVSIAFTAPTGGNGTITSYTATSSPTNLTFTGASSPIIATGLQPNTSYTFIVIATNSGGSSAYNFRVKSLTNVVPTVVNSFALTNTGSVAMINDATRGYVFNFIGSNTLSLALATPVNSTKSFWLSTATPTTNSANAFSTTKMPIFFNFNTTLRAGVNFPTATNVISTIVQTATWLFYTITTTATTTTMYVNGSQVATASVAWTGDPADMFFGSYNFGSFITARMDDIRFYSSILTPTEIATLYTTNSGTTSTPSTASSAVITLSDPPTSLVATTTSSTTVSVAFTPSTNATSYTITSSPGGFTGTGASSPIVVSGLSSNTSYTFTATSTGIGGTSVASTASNATTTKPSAPTSIVATLSATTASVAFTPPSGTGTITSYTITSTPGGFTGSGSSSPIVVSGLTISTSYTFTATATNSSGSSVASTASASVSTYTMRLNSTTSTVPTTADGFTINNVNGVAMINNATRGFVFSLTGSRYMTTSLSTPSSSTKTFWLSGVPPGSPNVALSTPKMPIWFSGTSILRASVNFGAGPTDVVCTVAQTSAWNFYCITTSPTTTTLYLNGVQNATANITWTGDSSTSYYFGAYTNGGSIFTGQLDDIRFYSSILTASQIQALYTSTFL